MSTTRVEEYLAAIREAKGEDAWKQEVIRLAKDAIKVGPKHAQYWKELTAGYEWLDWESLVAEQPTSMQDTLAGLLQQQMPGIKSQAQFDAVSGILQATQILINSILNDTPEQEKEANGALQLALTALHKATELTSKLEEVPEAVPGKSGEMFKQPPAQYSDYQVKQQLLSELSMISSVDELTKWYLATKEQRDKIADTSHRNHLLDSIRKKHLSL